MIHGSLINPAQPAVGLALLCILLDVVKSMWDKGYPNRPKAIDARCFFDGTLIYKGTDRVGGIISYLRKHLRAQLVASLGETHESMTEEFEQRVIQTELNDLYSSFFVVSGSPESGYTVVSHTQSDPQTSNGQTPANKQLPMKIPNGNIDDLKSFYEIIDTCLILYIATAHKYIMMVAELRDCIANLSERLEHDDDYMATESSESFVAITLDDNGATQNLSQNVKRNFYTVSFENSGLYRSPCYIPFFFRIVQSCWRESKRGIGRFH